MDTTTNIELNTIDYIINPKNKTQQKHYDRLREHLKITTIAEEFVLKTILSHDWSRQIIIQEIKSIKQRGLDGMISFKVYCTAPRHTVDYCCSNPYNEKGWANEKYDSLYERMSYCYSQLSGYLR
tara:strand:- start:46154 stop:46528 length:375 start_codon:yes stop_codon:yes gene_type:complete